jgi:hypothetical protein
MEETSFDSFSLPPPHCNNEVVATALLFGISNNRYAQIRRLLPPFLEAAPQPIERALDIILTLSTKPDKKVRIASRLVSEATLCLRHIPSAACAIKVRQLSTMLNPGDWAALLKATNTTLSEDEIRSYVDSFLAKVPRSSGCKDSFDFLVRVRSSLASSSDCIEHDKFVQILTGLLEQALYPLAFKLATSRSDAVTWRDWLLVEIGTTCNNPSLALKYIRKYELDIDTFPVVKIAVLRGTVHWLAKEGLLCEFIDDICYCKELKLMAVKALLKSSHPEQAQWSHFCRKYDLTHMPVFVHGLAALSSAHTHQKALSLNDRATPDSSSPSTTTNSSLSADHKSTRCDDLSHPQHEFYSLRVGHSMVQSLDEVTAAMRILREVAILIPTNFS